MVGGTAGADQSPVTLIEDASDVAEEPVAESVSDQGTPIFCAENGVIGEIRKGVCHGNGSRLVGNVGATPAGVPISRGHVNRGCHRDLQTGRRSAAIATPSTVALISVARNQPSCQTRPRG